MVELNNKKNLNLLDILACPSCKIAIGYAGDHLFCGQCKTKYPILQGVPIMLLGGKYAEVEHELTLGERESYAPWLHRMIIQSLSDGQIIVDAGSGNMQLDDPCIIRMDVKLTPYVDLVADFHALPFLPNSVDYIFALAVFEHLRQPFVAAEEIYQILKPGGYVYAEANFVYAYHGYPHHYFNISIQGLEEIFSKFKVLSTGVPPYHMPGFALQFVLSTYLDIFRPSTAQEREFAKIITRALAHPLYHYDNKIVKEQAYRLAAGDFLIGMKQANGETIIPKAIWDVYTESPDLKNRFPKPNNIFEPDNLMFWAKREGRTLFPAIADYFESETIFSKYWNTERSFDRSWINALPPIPTPGCQWFTDERQGPSRKRRRIRYLLMRALHHYREGGVILFWKRSTAFLDRWLAGRFY